jgi:hypothetical protein
LNIFYHPNQTDIDWDKINNDWPKAVLNVGHQPVLNGEKWTNE